MNDLFELLQVKPNDVFGILDEYSPPTDPSGNDLFFSFLFIRFQNDISRIENFIHQLRRQIVPFCLNKDKITNIEASDVCDLWREAKSKFANPVDNKTGEPGELIIFFLLEGYLRAPKIFTKMNLKTNSQMHVHGSDGVHLRLENQELILIFGESKVYANYKSGIDEAISSIKKFINNKNPQTGETQQEFEINIITNHLDIPDGPLRERVLNTLNPYHQERDNLRYSYSCFIGFDLEEIKTKCEQQTFQSLYGQKAENCLNEVRTQITSDPALNSLSWHFFFIPFGSVGDFRANFLQSLLQ
jgi:hypothetical protein